jgi:hypothetical protein
MPGGERVRSAHDGSFRIVGMAEGQAAITARRLGFFPLRLTVDLDATSDKKVDFAMRPAASLLAPLAVNGQREVYDSRLEGFNRRSQGKVGYFVTRERIDRSNSATFTDILREIPSVRINLTRPPAGRSIRLRGADCSPLVFVDGSPATAGEFDVDMIDLKTVEGIEVYAGLGDIPPEFAGPRDLDRCGVIAIWSRPYRPPVKVP